MPDRYIPLLEEHNLINLLDDWVLLNTTRQISNWQASGITSARINLNVSGRQISDKNFTNTVKKIIAEVYFDPTNIEMEITETHKIKDISQAQLNIKELSSYGIKVSIDDFGAGYGCLKYLKFFTINSLKIDRSLIDGIDISKKSYSIIKNLINFAHSLNLKVIAEGVETETIYHLLTELGCDEYQGFLFSKPLPNDQIHNLLLNQKNKIIVK